MCYAHTRPSYQVSVYRPIGHLVSVASLSVLVSGLTSHCVCGLKLKFCQSRIMSFKK